MKRDYFVFKTKISFAIATDDIEIDPLSISKELQLKSNRFHKKGDTFIGERTGAVGTRPRTVWAIDSEYTELEEETIRHHIEYFKSILLPKAKILKKYKDDEKYELSFWIWIETDDAGVGLDLDEDEMDFFNNFSNRIHFSLLTQNI